MLLCIFRSAARGDVKGTAGHGQGCCSVNTVLFCTDDSGTAFNQNIALSFLVGGCGFDSVAACRDGQTAVMQQNGVIAADAVIDRCDGNLTADNTQIVGTVNAVVVIAGHGQAADAVDCQVIF